MSSLTSNPFATRFISPGQVTWVGPEHYLEQLTLRCEALNCSAAIVGVHGSGKSTLLEHFVPRIGNVIWRRNAEGVMATKTDPSNVSRPTVWLQLREAVPQSMIIPWEELSRGRLLILDGYEQLSRGRRAMLIARIRLRGVKLLVTSHQRTILPTLCRLSITASTAKQIVMRLTEGRGEFATVREEEFQQCLKDHRGNMREILMDFYDRFEDRRAVGSVEFKSES